MANRYYVRTWDIDTHTFTPQKGVRVGPYSLWGLRKALRKLQSMGYDVSREDGISVLVEDEESFKHKPDGQPMLPGMAP